MVITQEPPDSPDAIELIEALESDLALRYAPEDRHGYSARQLVEEGVAFFIVREDGVAAACAGLLVCPEYAEVKRMYVKPAFRGRGLARRLLEHLEAEARRRGVSVLRLETGVHQHEAIALYERAGFEPIPSFGPYERSRISRCYEKRIGKESRI